MLGNILKLAGAGVLAFGAKKIYELIQDKKQESSESEEYWENNCREKEARRAMKEEPDPAMKLAKGGTPNLLETEEFYQELKKTLPKRALEWTDEQKNEFIRLTLYIFEGADAWDYIHAEDPLNIFELTQTKGRTIDYLRFIAETLPGLQQTSRLLYIIKEVERIRKRQENPIYDLNQIPSVKFQDIGLKLAVINQLMFKDETLKPKFFLEIFREEYKKYFLNPLYGLDREKAGEYMRDLDIPVSLLNKIEYLEINPTSEFYRQIYIKKTFDISEFFLKSPRNSQYIPLFNIGYSTSDIENELSLLPNLKEIRINLSKENSNKKFSLSDLGLYEYIVRTLDNKNIKIVIN